jgi:methylmalonyl-CoA mutase C-terminal domain/subunit
MGSKRKIRVLIAKPGLDGHDRGAKVITYALREAGMEVIYTGLRQTPEEIIASATQEDVDVIGLSILSGAQLAIAEMLMEQMREKGIADIPVLLGGVIPDKDKEKLAALGIREIFTSGTALKEVTDFVTQCAREKQMKEGRSDG